MKKLLLIPVLMLAFGSAHAFTNEDPFYQPPGLGNMSQEDYYCGAIQFSIRPKDGWVVWKQQSSPFTILQITGWTPQVRDAGNDVIEWRFVEVRFGYGIRFVHNTLFKGHNWWHCVRDIDQKLDVTPGVTLDADVRLVSTKLILLADAKHPQPPS